jgi:hypothetical protein
MKTLCIVPCGKTKIWDKNPNAGPTKAEYVYVGSFAKKCREYATTFYPRFDDGKRLLTEYEDALSVPLLKPLCSNYPG